MQIRLVLHYRNTHVSEFLHDARDVSDLAGHFGAHRVHLVADVKSSDPLQRKKKQIFK